MINFMFCKKLAWFWCLLFCDPKKWKIVSLFFFLNKYMFNFQFDN